MSKQSWTIEEEKIVGEYFFNCANHNLKPCFEELKGMLDREGFKGRTVSKIKAKYNDFKKIYEDKDISHVSSKTIDAYFGSKNRPTSLLGIYCLAIKPDSSKAIDKNGFVKAHIEYLSSDNPFTKLDLSIFDKNKDSFTRLLEKVIDNVEFNRDPKIRRKWSTVYTLAEVDHTTANEIRQGRRLTNIENLYKLFLMLFLDFETACCLLRKARLNFGDGITDYVVMMSLKNGIYNRTFINEVLIEKGEKPLFIDYAIRTKKLNNTHA